MRCLAIAVVLLPVSALHAQATRQPENLVVTASRTPVPAEQVGSVVTVIDRAALEHRQTLIVSDVLREVPGVAVSRGGPLGAQTQVRVRGAEANHLLVMIDGVEANDPAANDEFSFENLTAFDVQRIEIVRGPQTALWGSDALAGVVNVVTREPTEPLTGRGFLEAGGNATTSGGAFVGWLGESGSLALSASHLATDGENIAREGDEDDGYRNTTATLKGGYRAGRAATLEVFARHTDARREFDGVDFAGTGLPTDADLYSDVLVDYLRLGARFQAPGSLDSELRATWLGSDTENYTAGVEDSENEAEKYGLYYQASLPVRSDLDRLTIALEHEREKFRQRGAASPFGDPNQDQELDNTGAVLEYLANPTARLALSGSVRHDDNSDFDDATTYRLSVAYALLPGVVRAHASWGSGRKTPTFIERYGYYPDLFVGNPDLEPEKSEGWDAGIEQFLLGDRLRIDTTYFRADLSDEINGFVFEPVSGAFTARNEAGTSHRHGIEVALDADLPRGLAIGATYTYLDAEQPDPELGQAREIRRPRHSGSLNLTQQWLAGRAGLNLNATYTGERRDTFFPPFPEPAQTLTLADYTLVNFAASYALTPTLTLYGRVENLLDEDYEDVYGFNTPGRAAYLGLRMALDR